MFILSFGSILHTLPMPTSTAVASQGTVSREGADVGEFPINHANLFRHVGLDDDDDVLVTAHNAQSPPHHLLDMAGPSRLPNVTVLSTPPYCGVEVMQRPSGGNISSMSATHPSAAAVMSFHGDGQTVQQTRVGAAGGFSSGSFGVADGSGSERLRQQACVAGSNAPTPHNATVLLQGGAVQRGFPLSDPSVAGLSVAHPPSYEAAAFSGGAHPTMPAATQYQYGPPGTFAQSSPAPFYSPDTPIPPPMPAALGEPAAAQHQGGAPAAASDEGCHNLFIANISNDVDDDLLTRTFEPFGDILSAKVMLDIHTGRSRGFGFVMYAADKAGADAMRALHNTPLGERGQRMSVTKAQTSGRSAITETTKLYVRNVPMHLQEQALREHFAQFGTVRRFARKEDTASKNDLSRQAIKQSLPPAIVIFLEYSTAKEAQQAVRSIHGKKPWPGMAIPLLAKTAETTENRNVRRERQRQKVDEKRTQVDVGAVGVLGNMTAVANNASAHHPTPSVVGPFPSVQQTMSYAPSHPQAPHIYMSGAHDPLVGVPYGGAPFHPPQQQQQGRPQIDLNAMYNSNVSLSQPHPNNASTTNYPPSNSHSHSYAPSPTNATSPLHGGNMSHSYQMTPGGGFSQAGLAYANGQAAGLHIAAGGMNSSPMGGGGTPSAAGALQQRHFGQQQGAYVLGPDGIIRPAGPGMPVGDVHNGSPAVTPTHIQQQHQPQGFGTMSMSQSQESYQMMGALGIQRQMQMAGAQGFQGPSSAVGGGFAAMPSAPSAYTTVMPKGMPANGGYALTSPPPQYQAAQPQLPSYPSGVPPPYGQ